MGGYSKLIVISLVSLSSIPWTSAMVVMWTSNSSSTEVSVFMYASAAIFRGTCISAGEKTQLSASSHAQELGGKVRSGGWCPRVWNEMYLLRPSCFRLDPGARWGCVPVEGSSSWVGGTWHAQPTGRVAEPSPSPHQTERWLGFTSASWQPSTPPAPALRRRQRRVTLGTFKPVSPRVSLRQCFL